MPLMWLVPSGWAGTAIADWLIATGLILHTASTIHGVGFEGLTLELTPDCVERTRINSVKMIVAAAVGPLIGLAWLFTPLPYFHDPAACKSDILLGARVLVFIVAVVILIAGLAPALMARERFYAAASKQERTSLLKRIKTAFHNRAFMILSLIAVLAVSALFAECHFQRLVVEHGFGQQLLEPVVLGLEVEQRSASLDSTSPCAPWAQDALTPLPKVAALPEAASIFDLAKNVFELQGTASDGAVALQAPANARSAQRFIWG